jgi:hypothetical protein
MIRRIQKILIVLAALGAFTSGSALACSNYCSSQVDEMCVQVEGTISASCCLSLDTNGKRCWTCDRDKFWCMDGELLVETYGPPYNCHSPGAGCN